MDAATRFELLKEAAQEQEAPDSGRTRLSVLSGARPAGAGDLRGVTSSPGRRNNVVVPLRHAGPADAAAPGRPRGVSTESSTEGRRNRLTPAREAKPFGTAAEVQPAFKPPEEQERADDSAAADKCMPSLDEATRETPEYGGCRCITLFAICILNVSLVLAVRNTNEGLGGSLVPMDVHSNLDYWILMAPLLTTCGVNVLFMLVVVPGVYGCHRYSAIKPSVGVATLKLGSAGLTFFNLIMVLATIGHYEGSVQKLTVDVFVTPTLPLSDPDNPWTALGAFPPARQVYALDSDENERAQCVHYEQLVEFDFSTPPGGMNPAAGGRAGACYQQYARGIYPTLEGVRKCIDFSNPTFVDGDATALCCVKARGANQIPLELGERLRAISAAHVAIFASQIVFVAFDVCLSVSLIVLK